MQIGETMSETESTEIKTYKDFVQQLKLLQDEETAATLSFWKYCYKHRYNIRSTFKECLECELSKFGIKPYKLTSNFDCFVKFKNKAEAIIQIGACEVKLLICKL